jgi:hypothetical protein
MWNRMSTVPDDNANQTNYRADNKKEEGKHAPHVIFIRETERVDEAMALGRDPYPAFCAWQSALAVWAAEDPVFAEQAGELDAIIEETYQLYGLIPRLEYVRAWRPLYFGVMRRMGLFNDIPVEAKAAKSYFKGAAN